MLTPRMLGYVCLSWLQFDPILHTTPIRTDMPALVARPMLADPGGKRLKQVRAKAKTRA